MTRPAVFLDRDGTLIVRDREFLTDPADVRLMDGAADAVKRLRDAGYLVFVATNQSAVARGLVTERTLAAIHAKMCALLEAESASLDAVYSCPHHPEGERELYRTVCECRKPKPGMLRQAADEWSVDLARSWMVGDSERDLEAGRAVGARTILVRTGEGGKVDPNGADHVARDLSEAAKLILNE